MRNLNIPTSANYTEFLRDYLKNNTLPNELSNCDDIFECDFKELFTAYYYFNEIGFYTEELFKHHLQMTCLVNLPYYIEKATTLKTEFSNIFNSDYTITQTNDLINTLVNENTTNTRIDYETPTGSTTKTLPVSAMSSGTENTIDRSAENTSTGTIITEYSKNPRYNNLEALKYYQNEFKNIVKECLDSFAKCFMEVF